MIFCHVIQFSRPRLELVLTYPLAADRVAIVNRKLWSVLKILQAGYGSTEIAFIPVHKPKTDM